MIILSALLRHNNHDTKSDKCTWSHVTGALVRVVEPSTQLCGSDMGCFESCMGKEEQSRQVGE